MSNSLVYRPGAGNRRYWCGIRTGVLSAVALIVLVSLLHPSSFNGGALHTKEGVPAPPPAPDPPPPPPPPDETRLVVVNREANSVSIIRVKDATAMTSPKSWPRSGSASSPAAWRSTRTTRWRMSPTASAAPSRSLTSCWAGSWQTIPVGTEPRGCALTPNGTLLYVANHTEGTVSIFFTGNPLNPILVGAVQVGRNPTAIAITNNGDDGRRGRNGLRHPDLRRTQPRLRRPHFRRQW